MVRKSLLISLFLYITSLLFSMQAIADELEGFSRKTVLKHIQNAFDSQVSLTETARSKEEIKRILSTYLENDFIEEYMKENVHSLDDQFIDMVRTFQCIRFRFLRMMKIRRRLSIRANA